MFLIDADPEHLLPFADALHALTGGRIGTLRRVLARAMSVVIDEKHTPDEPEVIDGEHIFGAAGAGVAKAARGRPAGGAAA